MSKMTKAKATQILRHVGMTLRKTDGEYRVAIRGVSPDVAERSAYYTSDIEDAVHTGMEMRVQSYFS